MYSLMIVEDEDIIREGMRQCLDWSSFQIEKIYEATDGKIALNIAKNLKPDIILTDVVMPEMDGIELVRRLRQEIPDKNIRVIMISGHENVEYFKSALKLQVVDYLLKPFHIGELESIIRKVLQDCEADRRQNTRIQNLEQKMSISQSMVRTRFLHDICFRRLPASEIQMYMDILDEDVIGQGPYRAINFESDTSLSPAIEQNKTSRKQYVLFPITQGTYGGIWKHGLMPEPDIITHIFTETKVRVGVGSTVTRLEDIYQSFQQARIALINRSLVDQDVVIIEYEVKKRQKEEQLLGGIAQQQETILRTIENNDRSAIALSVYAYFDLIRRIDRNTLPFYQAYCSMLLIQVNQYFSLLIESSNTNPVSSALERINIVFDQLELEQLLLQTLDKLTEIIHSKPDQRKVVRTITEYIQSAYWEELTLTQIAAQVHLSPNYLANLFKKETGMTINDCITATRITEAKRLLQKETNLLVNELAPLVGYKDGKYFTKLFKREVGMNPSEYREKMR